MKAALYVLPAIVASFAIGGMAAPAAHAATTSVIYSFAGGEEEGVT